MAGRATVEAGPGRKQQWHRIAAAKLHRLLGVGVIDAVLVHPQVAVGPLIGPQRLTRHIELPRSVGERLESGRAAELEQIPDEVAPLLGGQGQGDVRRHERTDVAPLLDVGGGDVMALPRRIDKDDCLRRLLLDDALQHAAVGQGEGIRAIFRLHRPCGPVDRFDDLVRREALGDGRELRADCAPLPCHLVACRAAARGHVEHSRATPRVAVSPRVGEDLGDERLAVCRRDWLRRGDGAMPACGRQHQRHHRHDGGNDGVPESHQRCSRGGSPIVGVRRLAVHIASIASATRAGSIQ